jgi:hypothetical protein
VTEALGVITCRVPAGVCRVRRTRVPPCGLGPGLGKDPLVVMSVRRIAGGYCAVRVEELQEGCLGGINLEIDSILAG